MGVERAEDFPFTPLNTKNSAVRLLRLQRDQSNSIIGWLEPFSLEDPKCPPFNTLSYVWGEPQYSYTIKVNGHVFPILTSLYPILEVICNEEQLSKSWWWIDCICINQSGVKAAKLEQNVQVNMMKEIYQKSCTTIGWLGQGNEEGEDAIDFLRVLLKNKQRLETQDKLHIKHLGEELGDRKGWAALERLMSRPWWRRVWTLQEYIVAQDFIFYCGRESMNRDDFNSAIRAMFLCRKIDKMPISEKAFESAWLRRRVLMWYQEGAPIHLIGLMAYVGDYKASNPRDRIYSILGLAEDRSLASPPKYQDAVDKVYSKLVESFVQHYNSLDIICLTDRFNRYTARHNIQPILPSWVPDWRGPVVPWVVPAMACYSAGSHIGNFRPISEKDVKATPYAAWKTKIPLHVKFSPNLRIMTCQGIMVDFIDGIGGLKVVHRDKEGHDPDWDEIHDCIDSTSPVNYPNKSTATNGSLQEADSHPDHFIKFMEIVTRCLLLNREDRYLSIETPPGHLLEDFQAFCLAAMEKPTEVNPSFLDWFERSSSLHINGYSLRTLCTLTETLEKSKLTNFKETPSQNCFLSRFLDTTEWMTRRLLTTVKGHIGMGPFRAQKDDQIWVLLGCSIPLVLRKCEKQHSYELIGECYLDGYMNGEVEEDLRSGVSKLEEIQLL